MKDSSKLMSWELEIEIDLLAVAQSKFKLPWAEMEKAVQLCILCSENLCGGSRSWTDDDELNLRKPLSYSAHVCHSLKKTKKTTQLA